MSTKKPTFKSHTFKQECEIADREFNSPDKTAIGYYFNGGKRKFRDKVDKTKKYD